MNGRITLDMWPPGEGPPQVIKVGKLEPWATFMPSRHPTFKTHNTLGHAKSALTGETHFTGHRGQNRFHRDCALYQWDGINGQWILRVHCIRDTTQQDYTLWSNPKAFLAGVANVIQEEASLED